MAERKFYWLKMDKDFHKSKFMKYLERQPNPLELIYIYEELLFMTINSDGLLFDEGIEDSFEEEIYYSINSPIITLQGVTNLMDCLKRKGMITEIEEDVYRLEEHEKYVGYETDAAIRMRKSRKKKKLQSNVTDQKSVTGERTEKNTVTDNVTTKKSVTSYREEKSREEERRKEKREKKKTDGSDDPLFPVISEIILYLNQKTGFNYKPTTQEHQREIRKKLNEGHDRQEFFDIIDYKSKQWNRNPEMRHNLTATTLFRDKHFDTYLEQARATKSSENILISPFADIPEDQEDEELPF